MVHKISNELTSPGDRTAPPAGATFVALLLGLAGSAWLLSARLATPDMRLGVLTQPPMMSASDSMGRPNSMSMGLSVFLVTWAVMMVAMMVPSVLPAVRTFAAWARTTGQAGGAAFLFITGYLLVWSAVGGLAYLAVQALRDWLPAASMTAFRAGAVLLAVAGVYQLTPLKQACLRQCRSPLSRVTRSGLPAGLENPGPVHAGLWLGLYCLGSSWPLMLVLLLVGMMNLAWMAVIAGVIFVEKVVPGGVVVSKGVGWGLLGWGIMLLIAPHTAPVLGGV